MKSSIYLLLIICVFMTCSDEQQPVKKITRAEPVSIDGTARMVALLKEAHSKIDPMLIPYHLNSSRAENYKYKMESAANLPDRVNAHSLYAYELLQSGKTTEAIMEMEKLMELYKEHKVDAQNTYKLKQLTGLAYVRMGEQENCIGKNNPESCIIPIQGGGIYNLKKGSETAIKIYEGMLKERPDDMETIWLLNIAYMTIGKYPNGVPKQWRIPSSAFKSGYNIPPFKNIANQTIISTSGLAGGSCVEDFNNDGLLDIIASSWGTNDQIKVFFNLGNGDFKDQTDESGLLGITGGLNINHADYNNDGFIDVLVLRGGWFTDQGKIPNSLLKNNGDGTFSDVTIESGLLSQYPTQTATWSDFNRDGWLDLFIGNETSSKIQVPCELFINKQGKFENVTEQAGLGAIRGMVKGVCSGDINNDGWPDIYLSIMGIPNILMVNNGHSTSSGQVTSTNSEQITFSDQTANAGVQEPIQSFPTWMWDYDNDGQLDIFVAPFSIGRFKAANLLASEFMGNPIAGNQPRVYHNNGDGTFSEMSTSMGLTEPVFAMGSNYGDLDNDGSLDFYLGSGTPSYSALVPNKMYRNNNGKTFQDVTYSGRFGHIQKGHGISFGDFDNDGDQDIFHVLGGAFEGDVFGDALFENPMGNKKSWITIILNGTTANKSAIGARVKISCINKNGSEQVFYHIVSTGSSFGSNSLQLETGLGDAKTVKSIEVQWPNASGSVDVYHDIEIGRFVKITEGVSEVEYLERKRFSFGE
ncbi:MAG: hypothetical protein ACI8X3_003366 [Saprospiraceae bacterium]|jgi:hypothetical protein